MSTKKAKPTPGPSWAARFIESGGYDSMTDAWYILQRWTFHDEEPISDKAKQRLREALRGLLEAVELTATVEPGRVIEARAALREADGDE